MITTLPANLDRFGVSLEIIDGPIFTAKSNSTTIEQFVMNLNIHRNDLIFKQLDYRGSETLSDQLRYGLAYLFKRTHTLNLWDATVDLSDIGLDEPSPLKHLSLDYSFFKPHNQSKGY